MVGRLEMESRTDVEGEKMSGDEEFRVVVH